MSRRSWTPERMRAAILDVLQNGKNSIEASKDNGVPDLHAPYHHPDALDIKDEDAKI